MTVAELIDRLQKLPPDLRVVTPGFDESGFDDVHTVELIRVRFTCPPNYEPGICGAHEEDENGDEAVQIDG